MVDPKTIDQELGSHLNNEIIRASAGTGKTFALSNRYLVLLASGVDCQSILATTFTKKGAGEILDRIVQRLSAAAISESAAKTLSAELDFQMSREHASNVLHTLLKNLHRLEISTLDSFFNRVAKAFSLELGLPPIWDLVDEQQIQTLREEAVESVLRTEELETLRHLMDKGESTRRIQTLLMDTVKELYNDFRDSRFNAWDQLGEPTGWLTSTELETLNREAEQREYPTYKKVWDKLHDQIFGEQWAEVAESTLLQNVLDGNLKYSRSAIPEEGLVMIRQLIKHCRSWVIQALRLRNLATRHLLQEFGDQFESAKDRLGQLFFDDISDRLKNFVKGGTTEQFSFRLDHQIQHLMLDEFQDTSPTQWSIIRPFAHQVTRDGEPGRSFFCVGDMKQAIYGWRGGVAEIFDVVEDTLPNLAETRQMVKSYRSSPIVIEFVNDLFSKLDRFASDDDRVNESVREWANWFLPHETERTQYPGHVTIEYAENCDDSLSKTNSPSKNQQRNQNVVEAVVERVERLVDTLPADRSIGILTRTNKDVGEIIFALQSAGIAASEEGGNPLTDSAAVQMVLSAFHLADHPGDDIARYHISHGPLAELFDLTPEGDSNRAENCKAVAGGAALVRRLIVEQGFGPVVERMANLLADQCTRRERMRLQSLVELAYADPQDAQRWSLRPRKFVEYVQEKKVADATAAQVRVMTIHKSKGLEFDSVILPLFTVGSIGLSGHPAKIIVDRDGPADPAKMVTRHINKKLQKFLPPEVQDAFHDDDRRKIRESMCLLYVALTRAAHSLHVVVSCGEKPTSKTMAGVVLATMTEEPERCKAVLYESGDDDWYKKLTTSASAEGLEKDDEDQRLQLSKFYLESRKNQKGSRIRIGIQSRRGINSVVPSGMAGGDEVSLRDILGVGEDSAAMQRGTLLHACFELVQWLDQAAPTSDDLSEHLEKVATGSVFKKIAIKEFFNAIEKGSFPKLLNFESYREHYLVQFSDSRNRMEVFNERRFAATIAREDSTELIEGVVDRLILVYEDEVLVAADVIDFKSDSIGKHELAAKVAAYSSQLSAYREAVSVSLGLPVAAISTRLAFISTGDVINLDVIETTVDATTKLKSPPANHSASESNNKKTETTKSPKRVVNQTSVGTPAERSNKRIVNQKTVAEEDETTQAKPKPKKSKKKRPASDPDQKTLWD